MGYFFLLFASIILLMIGVAMLFKGINYAKYLIPIIGFGGGISLPRLFISDPNIYVLIAFGVFIAVLSYIFLRISLPILLGLFVGSFVYQILNISELPIWFVILTPSLIAVIFVFLAFKDESFKFVTTFVFSLIGGLLVMQALLILIPQSGFVLNDFLNFNIVNIITKLDTTVYSLSLIVLTMFGFFSQNVES
jgi:hypothetical protein